MTMNVMGRSMTTTTVVTDVQKGTIPASTFEVPAGYKAVSWKYMLPQETTDVNSRRND